MPKKNLLVVFTAMILLITGFASGQLVEFPEMSEDMDTLLKTHKQAIDARIGWWKDKLIIADTVDATGESCDKLMEDYAHNDSRAYKNFFVASCVRQLLPLLGEKGIPLDDKLRMVKLIHVASLLSKLRDRAILPALKSMSVNKNPAVRLLAWEGYRNSRSRFVTSRLATDEMLKAIGVALKTEKNPIILQAVYRLMNFRGVDTERISENTLKKINDFFLKTLIATWPARRQKVLGGNVLEIGRAAAELAILGYLGTVNGATAETKTKVLQMLLDMGFTAASVYDRTIGTAPKVNKACLLLLLECEQNLGEVAEMQATPLTKGLGSKVESGAAVQRAIFTWSDKLKTLGVTTPKPAADADKPDAKPATANTPAAK